MKIKYYICSFPKVQVPLYAKTKRCQNTGLGNVIDSNGLYYVHSKIVFVCDALCAVDRARWTMWLIRTKWWLSSKRRSRDLM